MDYKEFLKEFGNRSGFDFCDYSDSSISRRLQKICVETGLSFEQILDRVISDKEFVKRIVDDITVNTTELFRDPQVWISLYKTMYRQLPKASMLTFWHVGCSTGLEVYSNLIMLSELGLLDRARVIGTDINPRVLGIAKNGEYNYSFNKYFIDNFNKVMSGMGLNVAFDKYFVIDKAADKIRVREPLVSMPIFFQQDLVKDKIPFAFKVDVVFLRNVMIYFNDALQNKILSMLNDKMRVGASLIMGKQEDVPSKLKNIFSISGMYYKKTM